MSNINNQEPQAFGLIIFKTTFGNLDVELFTRQCPKATQNFVQLCLDGYYQGTIFERVEKDFIAVGGVHKESEDLLDDQSFPDEFHSRLRFTRRGLLATANTRKDENGPKFFFTLGKAPELQNKHTIFGRVKGNSIYSLVDLNECQVDDELIPLSEQKILEVKIVENPFPDLFPRHQKRKQHKIPENSPSDKYDPLSRPKPDPTKSKKLSFYPDSDDSDSDEGLSEKPVVSGAQAIKKRPLDLKPDLEERDGSTKATIVEGSQGKRPKIEKNQPKEKIEDEISEKERKLRELKAQFEKFKQQIEGDSGTKTLSEKRKADSEKSSLNGSKVECSESGAKLKIAPKNSKERERETMELMVQFKKRLEQASRGSQKKAKVEERSKKTSDEKEFDDEFAGIDQADGDDWLTHKFEPIDEIRLDKDASRLH